MLNQPECDFSVACQAFYYAAPGFYLERRTPLADEPGPYDIFSLVLKNWEKGFYRSHAVAVVGQPGHCRSAEFYADVGAALRSKINEVGAESLPFIIPEHFLAPHGGQFREIPLQHHPEDNAGFWRICRALDLAVHEAAPGPERVEFELQRSVRRAKRRPLGLAGWFRAGPASVYAMAQRKHFDDSDAFGEWLKVLFADRGLAETLLERQRNSRPSKPEHSGQATRNFIDTNGFYLLVFVVCRAVFGAWEFVLKQ